MWTFFSRLFRTLRTIARRDASLNPDRSNAPTNFATPPVPGRTYWFDDDGYRFEYERLHQGAVQFAVLSHGAKVGSAIFADYEGYFTIGQISVDGPHRGRMLATIMCLTAEEIFDEVLSEPHILSEDGRKFWDKYNSPEAIRIRRRRRRKSPEMQARRQALP